MLIVYFFKCVPCIGMLSVAWFWISRVDEDDATLSFVAVVIGNFLCCCPLSGPVMKCDNFNLNQARGRGI